MLRRLDPEKDRECFVEAWLWETSGPRWYKQSGKVFGPSTLEDFIEASKEETRLTFGIFDNELIGMIELTLCGNSLEADLMAKPRCNPDAILSHAMALRDRIFDDLGIAEIYVWLSKKNIPTRRLCAIMGFRETGLTLIRGIYHERVIEWVHMSIPREAVAMLKAA
jgi:hypothetical protein